MHGHLLLVLYLDLRNEMTGFHFEMLKFQRLISLCIVGCVELILSRFLMHTSLLTKLPLGSFRRYYFLHSAVYCIRSEIVTHLDCTDW
jgi:hypothetical protein